MKRILYNKFDKKAIQDLPRATFPGEIVTVASEEEANKAVDFLLSQTILGVDTETRPMFRRGQHHQVALLQVSTKDTCFLFRLNKIGLPACLIRLLEDKSVPKIGLSLNDDMSMLHQRANFTPGNFIDLQKMVKDFGIEDMSLQKLYANVFHERVSKREQLSNWENDVLNDKQKIYAATDAWTCINLYEVLSNLQQTGNYEIFKAEENNHEQDSIS